MLNTICERTDSFIQQMPKALRKEYGQFFTSKETARYMASLFTLPLQKHEIHILDAGAGSGILSVALIERCNQCMDEDTVIHVTCYENDSHIQQLLEENLKLAAERSHCNVQFEILAENYIVSQCDDFNHALFCEAEKPKYDLIIGNPPYKKIGKDAPEALAMPEVCHGAPNLYFLFAAMGIHNLKEESEMVYITPRSWTSGAYFKNFRTYMFKHSVLTHIHLFGSRNKVFDKEEVLQETMIMRFKKTRTIPERITISSTRTNHDFQQIRQMEVPYSVVVSGDKKYVHLVTAEEEIEVLDKLNRFGYTLADHGLKMKTGLVVDFRSRDLLSNEQKEDTIPLIYSQHIKDGRVRFPQGKGEEYIQKGKSALMQENKNYLFIKRFTAKEEPRRLQCGIYLKKYLPEFPFISSQNKVNFIDGMQEMSECVVYGLYVIFNSTLYDIYYRILNGSTQVNSTEVNSMPMPAMETIESMGRQLIANKDLSVAHCNQILNSHIYE